MKKVVSLLFLCSLCCSAEVLFEWRPDKEHIKGKQLHSAKASGTLQTKAGFDPQGNLIFDNQQYIEISPEAIKKVPLEAFSVEAMVRIDNTTDWGGIIGFQQDNGKYEKGWLLGYQKNHFTFKASTDSTLIGPRAGNAFYPGKWTHLAGVYDGKTISLYVDGKLGGSRPLNGPIALPTIPTSFVIGGYKDKDENFPMDGRIKMIRVHNRALTKQEIKTEAKADSYKFSVRPKLRFTSPNEALISWEATEAGKGVLAYGIGEKFQHFIESESNGNLHQVTLKNLQPGTVYSYKVAANIEGVEKLGERYEFNSSMNHVPPSVDRKVASAPARIQAYVTQSLALNPQQAGVCLVLGGKDGAVATEVARQSKFKVIIVESDPEVVATLRQHFYNLGLYGSRVSIHAVENLSTTRLTSQVANLILTEQEDYPTPRQEILRLLRPNSSFTAISNGTFKYFSKPKDPGAGAWTHQYGSAANTSNVNEELGGITQTNQLEVQWFGIPGGDFGIDRGPRMPAPLAINGRLFHQGHDRMIAMDSYNGQVLWSYEIPDLRRVNIPHDCSNWCADKDHLYVAVRDRAWKLKAATGEQVTTFKLTKAHRSDYDWGFIAQHGDYLVGTSVKQGSQYQGYWKGDSNWYEKLGSRDALAQVVSDNFFAYDKSSGNGLWAYSNGKIINSSITIENGKALFLENRHPAVNAQKSSRVSINELWTEGLFLVCLDLSTGSKLWEKQYPKLKYVNSIKDFVQAGYGCATGDKFIQVLSQGTKGSKKGRYTYHCFSVSNGDLLWRSESPWRVHHHSGHIQHPVIMGDRIYCDPCGLKLSDGSLLADKFGPREGCSSTVGTKDTLFFRGIKRCLTAWGTEEKVATHWPRLRPSCWLSFIPSNGMFLVPEGGAGCSCGGWMETSIGFAPIPMSRRNNKPAAKVSPNSPSDEQK